MAAILRKPASKGKNGFAGATHVIPAPQQAAPPSHQRLEEEIDVLGRFHLGIEAKYDLRALEVGKGDSGVFPVTATDDGEVEIGGFFSQSRWVGHDAGVTMRKTSRARKKKR
jgi:hypothetical protein